MRGAHVGRTGGWSGDAVAGLILDGRRHLVEARDAGLEGEVVEVDRYCASVVAGLLVEGAEGVGAWVGEGA